jgi:hypothetical protein
MEMNVSGTERLVVGGFNGITIMVTVVVSRTWLATLADQAFYIGWGWDRQILWVAPIIVVGAMLLRLVGRGTLR